MHLRVAYFINQYPKISHTFIRREILALEKQGVEVLRIALRGWDANLVDALDQTELDKTRYVLRQGTLSVMLATMRVLFRSPAQFISTLWLAVRMGWRADRPIQYHLIYFMEACQVLQWLRSAGIHHVHAHFSTNSAEVVMLAHSLGGPPYSFTVHGPEEFDGPKFLKVREKINRSTFVVAISSFGRSQLYRWIDHKHWPKVKLIRCGLESAFFQTEETQPPTNKRLVCVGRLCEQKGQLLLIEAARRLAAKGIEFELTLVGDGEMREEVERLVDAYSLRSHIRITGWASGDQVREEIMAARCLVLPSFAEGLPVVIMEAMALWRPIISTYVAGIPELVVHGENGWLVPAGSISSLTEVMESCLTASTDHLRKMGEAGYHRVIKLHSIEVEASKLTQLFSASAPDVRA